MKADDRRLKLVRGTQEAIVGGQLDAALDERARGELLRSLVSLERWLAGPQRTFPEIDATRAVRRLSWARSSGRSPYVCRALYWWLSNLVWRRKW